MINSKYKDRLFSFIFGREENKSWTLSLYNAVNGTAYENPEEIEINTINDAVYMRMKNDVSFILGSDMNLYAHQSSYNPNMPLRELIYAALLYDKYVHEIKANIYGQKLIKLPTPKLIVFYNGTKDTEDETVLELKTAFGDDETAKKSDIQVRVRMLNINYGRNRKLLELCEPLMEYSWFIDRIRQNRYEGIDIYDAVNAAVADMPDEFMIKRFIIANKAEVSAMCITEYNETETMEMFREEGREEGENQIVEAISKLKSGVSKDDLIKEGFSPSTVERASMCI